MVFAWNAESPDPRQDPTLIPTGQHAVVMDRNGYGWSIYEFSYHGVDADDDRTFGRWLTEGLQDRPLHHAYGVRLGDVHRHHDDWPGEDRYNWALSYRLERLFPDGPTVPAFDPARIAAAGPAQGVAEETNAITDPLATSVDVVGADPTAEPRPAEYHLEFGLGLQPEALDRYDPASGGIERLYR